VLQFLFTEINYGGRVTDDKDRRLMSNLIKAFCGPEVLQEGYSFSPSGTYTIPGCETVAQVRLGESLNATASAHRCCASELHP
jgi:dynein heavy chain